MFTEGAIVYFKNPLNFGRIISDTEIGPRWALSSDCEPVDTVPIIAAIAGILKNKFIVTKEIPSGEGTPGTGFVLLKSADISEIEIVAKPEFISEGGSSSTILSNNERKLLLSLANLLVEDGFFEEEDEEFEDPEVPEVKISVSGKEEPLVKDVDQCSECGKCNGRGHGRKSLEEKAAAWESTYNRDQNSEDEEDFIDFDELVDSVVDEVMHRLSTERARQAPRRPNTKQAKACKEMSELLDELFGSAKLIRAGFNPFL